MHQSTRRATYLLILVSVLGTAGACSPTMEPMTLAFSALPTAEGLDVRVDVAGGDPLLGWVGFGIGPGSPERAIDRVIDVSARDESGATLTVRDVSRGGYRVELDGAERWTLFYRLDLEPITRDEAYYRTSSRGSDFLILLGSDAWARFFTRGDQILEDPGDRAAGPVTTATIRFDLTHVPADWTVVSTAPATDPGEFLLTDHPINTVFAIGPYEVTRDVPDHGLGIAMHRRWAVERSGVARMFHGIAAVLRDELGPPGGGWATAIFTPLPSRAVPRSGVRTAGMVRGKTMLLFADVAPGVSPTGPRIRDTVARFLGHELFHLYVPWGVGVTPELAWLSEGWAMRMGRRAAAHAGFVSQGSERDHLREAYRNYVGLGGFRAGSLPAASLDASATRDILYLRGELVFEVLARVWSEDVHDESFDAELWRRLAQAYDGIEPLAPDDVLAILSDMIRPVVVRRFVEGAAPITPGDLGMSYR